MDIRETQAQLAVLIGADAFHRLGYLGNKSALIRDVEYFIYQRGLQEAYIEALIKLLDLDIEIYPSAVERGSPHASDMYTALWMLIHATTEDKYQAALIVLTPP